MKAERRRLGVQLLSIAVEGAKGRGFLSPAPENQPPVVTRPLDAPELELQGDAGTRVERPSQATVADLFLDRQLEAIGALADAVARIASQVREDGGDSEYARAVASVLGLCVGKLAQDQLRASAVEDRLPKRLGEGRGCFQSSCAADGLGLPGDEPVWRICRDWLGQIDSVIGGLRTLPEGNPGVTSMSDARTAPSLLNCPALVATDPPYFGQIGYADLSDYFYVWHRRALQELHPDLYATIATPKSPELIAAPHRHGGDRNAATRFFVEGFTQTFGALRSASRGDLPILIVYAHRQEESDDGNLQLHRLGRNALRHASTRVFESSGLGRCTPRGLHARSDWE